MSGPGGGEEIPFETTLDLEGLTLGLDQIKTALEGLNQITADLATSMTEGFDEISGSIDGLSNTVAAQTRAMGTGFRTVAAAAIDTGTAVQGLSDILRDANLIAQQNQEWLSLIASRLTEVDTQTGNTTSSTRTLRSAVNAANLDFNALNATLDNVLPKFHTLTTEERDAANASSLWTEAAAIADDALSTLTDRLATSSDAYGAFVARQTEEMVALGQLDTAYAISENSINLWADTYNVAYTAIQRLITEEEQQATVAQQTAAASETAWANYAGAVSQATTASGGFGTAVAGGINYLANNVWQLGIAAGLLDRFGLSSINAGADFQRQFSLLVNVAADKTKDNVDQLSQYLIQMGPVWGQTPTALAQGLYYVMSAGFHGADALDILKQTAYGASGGIGNMADIAKAVTTLLYDYGLKGQDAADATKYLIDATVEGKTTVDDLANSLGKITGVASETGFSMTSLLGGMDALTRSGLSAAQSSTYLRQVMMQLGMRADTVATTAQSMGISLDAGTLQQFAMSHSSTALADALKYVVAQIDIAKTSHGDLAQQTAFANEAMLKLFGGVRSGTGAINLSTDQFQNLDTVLHDLSASTLTSQDHFNDMSKNLSFKFLQAKAALAAVYDQFVITFGPSIASAVSKITDGLQRLTTWLQTLKPDQIKHLGEAVLGLVGLINGLFVASLIAVGLRFSGLTGLLEGGGGAFRGIASLFGSWGNEALRLSNHLPMVGSEASGLLGHFHGLFLAGSQLADQWMGRLAGAFRAIPGLIRAIPDALVAGVEGMIQFSTKVGLAVRAIGGGIGGAVDAVGRFLPMLLHPMDLIWTIEGGLRGGLSALWGVISGGLPALLSMGAGLAAIIGPILLIAGVIAIVVLAFTRFRTQTMAAIQPLLPIFIGVFENIKSQVMQAGVAIVGIWRQVWPQIQPAMTQLLAAVKNAGPIFEVLGTIIKIVAGIVIGAVVGLANGFIHALPFIINFVTGVISFITHLAQIVQAIFSGQWGKIPGLVGAMFVDLLHIIGSAAGAILSFVGNLITGVLGWFGHILGASNPVVQLVQGIIGFFQNLWHTIVGGSIVPDLINGVISWFGKLPGQLLGIVGTLVGNLLGAIGGMKDRLLTLAQTGAQNILDGFANVPGQLLSAGANMIQHLADGITSKVAAVKNAVGNIVGSIADHFPHSPAKVGPLTTIDTWGPHINEALSTGLSNSAGTVEQAALGVAGRLAQRLSSLPAAGVSVAVRGSSGLSGLSGLAAPAIAAALGGGTAGALGLPAGAGTVGGVGFPGAGGTVQATLQIHIEGDLAAAFAALPASDREAFARVIGETAGRQTFLQNIHRIGYASGVAPQ